MQTVNPISRPPFQRAFAAAPREIQQRVLALIEEVTADPFPDNDRKVSVYRPPVMISAIDDGVVTLTYYIRDNASGRIEVLGFAEHPD